MPANILTTGEGAADSADVVIAAGAVVVVSLKGHNADSMVQMSLKDDTGAYLPRAWLSGQRVMTTIQGPGTWRFSRQAGTCGVFSA